MSPGSGMLGHVTAMPPTWDILVPTIGERRALFERLMAQLLPQAERAGAHVRVVGWFNNGTPSLPVIRQAMVAASLADYVSFVDDDDLVSPYYVAEIGRALADRPDYVGFQVQCYSDGAPVAIAYHSLEHKRWVNERTRYLRDISHLNPIRTSLARRGDFRRAGKGSGEDREWAGQLRRLGIVRSQVVVPRVLYHYLHVKPTGAAGSRWKDPSLIRPGDRAEIDHPNFTWSDRD